MAYRSVSPPFVFDVAALTRVGRYRDHNEDAFSLAAAASGSVVGPPLSQATRRAGAIVCGVYDGCGGSRAGAFPSQVVARVVHEALPEGWWCTAPAALGSLLASAVQTAAQYLFHHRVGMGTTATLVAAVHHQLHLAHVGDSRVYLLRDDTLTQLSRDHTLVAELRERGLLKPEEQVGIVHRNVMLRVLGVSESVEVDAHTIDLLPGDRVLLCSDGLSDKLDDAQMAAVLRQHLDPSTACRALLDAAEEADGSDNLTVVVVTVALSEGGPPSTREGG